MRLLNFVKFATSTTGTGDIAVGTADTGFVTPAQAGIANGDRVPYVIDDGTDWAFGVGVYSTTGPTLARDANEVRVVSGTKTTAKLTLSGAAKVYFDVGEAVLLTRPDVLSQASASSIIPDINNYSTFRFTALAANSAINAPSGTPYDGQEISLEIRDNGTARLLAWNAKYVGTDINALPGSTTAGQIEVVGFSYYSALGLWICTRSETVELLRPVRVGGGTSSFTNGGSNMLVDLATIFTSNPLAEGDRVYLWVTTSVNSNIDFSMNSAGWTELADLYINDSEDGQGALFAKTMGASPDSSAIINAIGSSIPCAVCVVAYRRVNTSSPEDVAVVTATGTDTGRPDPGSITPVTPGAVVVAFGAGSAPTGNTTTFTSSDLGNFITTHADSTFDDVVAGCGDVAWVSGTFNPAQFGGGSAGTANSWSAATVAIRPITPA